LSRDLIRKSEFLELCLLPEAGSAGTPAPGGVRVRQLVERLERAEEDAARRAQEAAERAEREAKARFTREFGAALTALQAAARELESAREREKEVAVEEIVHLAVAVAGKIVDREVRRDDEYVVRLVKRCLRRIPFPAPLRIRLHPEDVAAVSAARDLLAADGSAHRFTFEGDRRVERGSCVVDTPDFVVDGRARVQLATARAALEGDS
jgi:flagellar assembly protein FliH